MAAHISNRMKFTILVLIGMIGSGVFYVYQKLFGGKAQILPKDQFIVGPSHTLTVSPSQQKEEIVAVSYSENIAMGIDAVIKRTGNLDFI